MDSFNKDENKYSIVRRAKSVAHASRGLWIFLKTTPNAWFQILVFFVAICLGFYFQIAQGEWMMLVLVGGLVLMSEAFNTAIEIDMDLTSPNYHPYARDTKDVAAGAVLICSIIAAVIGLIIFVPYFFLLF